MTAVAMDTYKIVKRLTQAGFSDSQAEVVTDILRESRDLDLSSIATKTDLAELKAETKADLTASEHRLETAIAAVEHRLDASIAASKIETIKWVVGIGFAQVAMVLTVLKLFPSAHP